MIEFKKGYAFSSPTALTIGSFDGMHKGHQFLLQKLKDTNLNTAILTFSFLEKQKHLSSSYLMTLQDKEDYANSQNIATFCYLNFDRELQNTDPVDFIKLYLQNANIKVIIIGADFHFGKGGVGEGDLLKKLLLTIDIQAYPPVNDEEGVKISTTEIINLLSAGKIERANENLGRGYEIKGRVVLGCQNGKKLGFPTANIVPSHDYVIPANGVYATYITIGNTRYLSMTNIGIHPTISRLQIPAIETHIFGYDHELYNKNVKLEFIAFIREEKKFDRIDELIEELKNNKRYIIAKYKK